MMTVVVWTVGIVFGLLGAAFGVFYMSYSALKEAWGVLCD